MIDRWTLIIASICVAICWFIVKYVQSVLAVVINALR